jgi:hypothetical protein
MTDDWSLMTADWSLMTDDWSLMTGNFGGRNDMRWFENLKTRSKLLLGVDEQLARWPSGDGERKT